MYSDMALHWIRLPSIPQVGYSPANLFNLPTSYLYLLSTSIFSHRILPALVILIFPSLCTTPYAPYKGILAIFSEVRLSSSIGNHFFLKSFSVFAVFSWQPIVRIDYHLQLSKTPSRFVYTKSYLDVKGMFAWVWRVSMQYINFTTMDSLGSQRCFKLRSCWTP